MLEGHDRAKLRIPQCFLAAPLEFLYLGLIPGQSLWEIQHDAESAFCFMALYKRTYHPKVMGYVADSP